MDKSEATNYDSLPAPAPKRKRGKGESSIIKEAAELALEEMETEEPRPKKMQSTGTQIECPMFVMTPEMAKRAKEYADKLTADKKKKADQYIVERDERLWAIGQENCAACYEQKLVEVKKIAGKVEQDAVKEAQKIVEKFQGTPEVGASGSAPESAALEAERSGDQELTSQSK